VLNALDLFSGIAGNTLALRDYCKVIAYCEADRHAQAVLISRMSDGSIQHAPICTDIRELSGIELRGVIDIIVGGFPCQDISVAGNGKGLEGERSGLFFQILRLAEEIEPAFLFLENVPAIRTRGLARVIGELSRIGYDCRWTMLSAQEVGAHHRRERWFCLAYRSSFGWGEGKSESKVLSRWDDASSGGKAVANANVQRLEVREQSDKIKQQAAFRGSRWEPEPDVDRVVNGLPHRVDRIKRLGNAVVPAQAKTAFEILMGIRNENPSHQ